MQNHLKYLVIEDEQTWSQALGDAVRDYFVNKKKLCKARVVGASAYDGRQANQQIASQETWDLLTLDMNLGQGAGKSRISGLDLLGDIAAANKAYFVIIVTGAVTDPTLEKIYGSDAANLMRFGAMNEAVRLMPAARVRILHKPEAKSTALAMKELLPQLHSALDQYCAVSLDRNIFRPMPGAQDLWEVCYNGGPRLTIPHINAFEMMRSTLAQPGTSLKTIELIAALAQSSGRAGVTRVEKRETSGKGGKEGTKASDFEHKSLQDDAVDAGEGLAWDDMSGMSVREFAPSPSSKIGRAITLDEILGGLLQSKRNDKDLELTLVTLSEAFGEEPLISLPARALEWSSKGNLAARHFERDDAAGELAELAQEMRPLLEPYRKNWLAKKAAGQAGVGSHKTKVRVAKGEDTPEMKLARQHWSRFQKAIEKHECLRPFLAHVVASVPRDPSTKGTLLYRPTGNDLPPFWRTE